MTDTPEMRAEAGYYGTQHPITASEFAKRAAGARADYAKFKSHFDYRGAAEAYRNMLFDTFLRRITILSGSEFGCAGELLADDLGPYLKISEAGFIDPHPGSDADDFWEKNFGYGAEVRHLENPLGLDLQKSRVVIVNEPGTRGRGRYLAMPALSGDRFVGIIIVAGAPGDYTQESIGSIQSVVDVYSGVIEYLRADSARAAEDEKDASPAKEIPAIVFNCNIDAGRTINYIAGQVELITGYRESDFTGGGVRNYASLIDANGCERIAEVIARRLKERKPYEVEYQIARADGSKRRVYERGLATYDAGSSPVSIDAAVLDITETEQLERGTRQYRRRFQSLIEDQTKSYVAQRLRAQQAAKAKSEFISNISHELRTPMHAILSYSKMGIEDCGSETPEALKDYFTKIQSAGARLLSLINNLLDISRMDAGKLAFKKSLSDFSKVVEHTLNELDTLIKSKLVSVTTETATENTKAIFDKQRMIQVMVNLISNAVRFSSSGDVIRVRLADGRLPDGGQALCCSVADNGPGIPEGELEAVFGKFIQSSKTKTGAGGTGLGLAICRDIVEAHSGTIWAENRKPKGAVLSFTIPRNAGLQAS
jgi:PAS domain S-box-containing protein